MSKYLVVVESPAKARTIEKYLGKDYKVMASYGHVQDLIPKEGAVDVAHDFAMKYQEIERNSRHMDAIAKEVKKCTGVYLAPDPDREGEAIAWSVKELLEKRDVLKDKELSRVVFHQITKASVQEAIANPRAISMDLVHAQQARRALDYLVGFNLSPLLWKKIRPGLSAGRVQSPALRMIVEREEEIEKFIAQEYWTIHAKVQENLLEAKLTHYKGEKLEQFTINNEKDANKVVDALTKAAKGKITVTSVTKKDRKRYPAAPFITATLQQEAARKLGFSAQRTMQVAQQLYEGIDIGEGEVGLITYMRTDSVTLANEAIEEIRGFIPKLFGKENVPEEPRVYKTKSKNAQEAHEAIRPTSILREPKKIKKHLKIEQYKLYELIWKRTIASQMLEATMHTVSIDLSIADSIFRATGSTIANPGFIAVYQEGGDDAKEDGENLLPPLKEGEVLDLEKIQGDQHFTEPPPRFTEASLVKGLEERDIGRPSTYASIISTLRNREYVDMDNKRFKPTDVGRIVNRFLTNYFTQYVDYGFTASLEDELDAVARGDKSWIPLLKEFWKPFKKLVDHTQEHVTRKDVTQEIIDEKCPKCNSDLAIRLGKRGRFIGCTAYPECDYTRNMEGEATNEPEIIPDRKCPDCGHDLVVRTGKYGKFIGCSHYPECHHMEPLDKPEDSGVQCPKCKEANIFKRKSRRGKIFFSCNRYPECDYALWNEPVNEPCPNCKWPILTIKTTKKRGTEKLCPQRCGYIEKIDE